MTSQENKAMAALVVACVVIGLWIVGILLAINDGDEMLKILTPFTTTAFGWLFTAKATGG